MSNTKETGNYGEIQASNYLVKKGYTIIARNYYGKHGEIDIIAVTPDNTTLVFVEVKTRKSKLFGVIEVYYKIINNDELILDEINHIKNAFYDISNYI